MTWLASPSRHNHDALARPCRRPRAKPSEGPAGSMRAIRRPRPERPRVRSAASARSGADPRRPRSCRRARAQRLATKSLMSGQVVLGLRALRSFETPGWRLHAGFDSRSSGPRPRPSKRQRPPERAARGPRQRRDLIWHVVLARKCLWRWPCRSRWRAAAVRAFRRCPRSGRRWSRFRCQGHDTILPTW